MIKPGHKYVIDTSQGKMPVVLLLATLGNMKFDNPDQ
jgi:hypothetical protein